VALAASLLGPRWTNVGNGGRGLIPPLVHFACHLLFETLIVHPLPSPLAQRLSHFSLISLTSSQWVVTPLIFAAVRSKCTSRWALHGLGSSAMNLPPLPCLWDSFHRYTHLVSISCAAHALVCSVKWIALTWVSWCTPCCRHLQLLEDLHRDRPISILSR
jgi:hypothetical protein